MIEETKIEDWDWMNTCDDFDISETLLTFDPPLNLVSGSGLLHHFLYKLHESGVKYDNNWGGGAIPILKHKTKVKFGNLSREPVFYKNSKIHTGDSDEYLYYLSINKNSYRSKSICAVSKVSIARVMLSEE